MRILLIDDTAQIAMMYADMLRYSGMSCEVSTDPREGLRRFEEAFDERDPYVLVICDLAMPEMSGFEVVEEMRKRDKKVPVLFLSAYVEDENTPVRAQRLGASVMGKPAGVELVEVVRELISPSHAMHPTFHRPQRNFS
jgi:DNA-binding response OmpR family regulator